MRRSLQDYVDASTDAASAAEAATTQAFATMEDALVSFVTTGKVEFGSLADVRPRRHHATRCASGDHRPAGRQHCSVAGRAGEVAQQERRWAGGESAGFLAGLGTYLAGLFHTGEIVG